MDGLTRPSGKGDVLLKIPKCWESEELPNNGKEGFDEYRWPAMRVEEYAVVEQHLLKHRLSPIDALLPDLEKLAAVNTKASRRLAKVLQEKAYADLRKSKATNKLTVEEVQAYLDSVDGLLFTMRICLARYHPTVTDADTLRIFNWMGEEEAKRTRDLTQGLDALGNSTGPTPEAERAAGESGLSTGDGSTAGSLPNTVGPPAT